MNNKNLPLVIALICMLFRSAIAQAQQRLWGVTPFGGEYDGGTIFHFE